MSYFVSSNETTASVFGYREPFDYRQPECFSAESSVPDCRAIAPFNYDSGVMIDEPVTEEVEVVAALPVERHVYFPDVNFDFDVRNLNTLGEGKARQVARLLQEEPGVHVVLEGHADYMGSVEYNEKLGMDRAEAVRGKLIEMGVPAERISTVTFGQSKPIFEDQTDWARAVNRRVSVHVSSEG
jgi:outer membrane protein OmpA-like peptidoglycan-associated protein